MEGDTDPTGAQNPSNGGAKPKVVVILGPTGSGKTKLSIDLASHFPIEIINADSMQVYRGLDVLTNKVPSHEQNGVPHHLLGTVSPNVEFTAKEFRDSAISVVDEILSRDCLPVIVGGTNYYIQALVSPFLLDESAEDMGGDCLNDPEPEYELDIQNESFKYSFNHLKEIDPIAANRIHPNDNRKINQYLSLYFRTGFLPSNFFQGKAAERWGQADYFRYDCCFICVDASLSVLDQQVDQRVEKMVDAGLLDEVFDIYNQNADYTRGLRQAIGVREFEDFLGPYIQETRCDSDCEMIDGSELLKSNDETDKILKEKMQAILNSSTNEQPKILLKEAIDKVKLNTRRLVRRQRRRLKRLQTLFGWNIHYVDATEYISCKLDDSWTVHVVEPAIRLIRSFLSRNTSPINDSEARLGSATKVIQRDLWTQYTCMACGDRVLRGAHEWEQHKQGRGHRKRISRLRKLESFS